MLQLLEKGGKMLSMEQVTFLLYFFCQKDLFYFLQATYHYVVNETVDCVTAGTNEAVGMSSNLVSMLENTPLAYGGGDLFSGEDETSGV